MLDFGLLREVLQSLNKNKLRTLLSGFTVAFAIMLFTILFRNCKWFSKYI